MQILEVAFSGTIGTRTMGPVSTDIFELANRFADRGHEVIVTDVAGREPRDRLHRLIRLLELPGIPESRIESSRQGRMRRHLQRWKNSHSYVRTLATRVDLAKADVVHFHSSVPAFIAQRLYGAEIFYTAHTPLWSLEQSAAPAGTNGESTQRRSAMGRFHTWVERDVIRRGRLTVGLGDYLASAVPGAQIVTIPNGVDCGSWSSIDRASARAALGIGPREFVVVFAGRIKHVKGVDVLLEAVRLLAPSLPALTVFVIGPLSSSFDSRDDYVEPYARKMMELSDGLPVRLLGFINNRDILFRQYFAAADVSVLPSRAEPQGKVALESLAMSTPVIGSATGGIPDMVSADVGYLFPAGDAVSLAARIKQAHDRPWELQDMRKAARARVEAQYSWDGVADRYLAEFERVVQSRGRRTSAAKLRDPGEVTL